MSRSWWHGSVWHKVQITLMVLAMFTYLPLFFAGIWWGASYLTADADDCPTLQRNYHGRFILDEEGRWHVPPHSCRINRFEYWYNGYGP